LGDVDFESAEVLDALVTVLWCAHEAERCSVADVEWFPIDRCRHQHLGAQQIVEREYSLVVVGADGDDVSGLARAARSD